MKLAVCINHVPDTASKINVVEGRRIDTTGITFVLNPYDEFAIEECLRLKEKRGGEVIAVSLGTDTHKESLRKALAMGVDRAVPVERQCTSRFLLRCKGARRLLEGNFSQYHFLWQTIGRFG